MKILLIEDDLDDVELLKEGLKFCNVKYTMDVIHDGIAALEYIHGKKAKPSIIIMDFNIPKVHGRELLPEIKASSAFKDVPLVILSTSSAAGDIEYSYRNGANKYMIKPSTMVEFRETIETITSLARVSSAYR